MDSEFAKRHLPISLLRAPSVDRLLDLALDEDLGRGDVTTDVTLAGGHAVGHVVTRAPLVCAGVSLTERLVRRAGFDLMVEPRAQDGERLDRGAAIVDIQGDASQILAIERTLLNLLTRMCAIATQTRQFVDSVAKTTAAIVDTRKTLPGWRVLDKYAVAAGGGRNHRFDLGSGVLIKDNHIVACGSVQSAVERARRRAPHSLRIEVEVDTAAQLAEALDAQADVIMLDNMSPEQVRQAVQTIGGRATVEVSGGVSLASARAYAEAGADLISVGALTHSPPAVDVALDMVLAGDTEQPR